MPELIKPPVLPGPFAYNGDKNEIPDAVASAGAASFQQGFPPVTQLPVTAGGIPPQRGDFNGILHTLSRHAFWQQSGGLYDWSEELDYAVPALVAGSDGELYNALQASGPGTDAGDKNPTAAGSETWWRKLDLNSLPDVDGLTIVLKNGLLAANASVAPEAGKMPLSDASARLAVDWMQDATTAQKGVVKLNSSTNSTSVTEAATPAAVKQAYDRAASAGVTLNNTVTSTSTTEAATANAVKTAYDKAVAAAGAGSGIAALTAWRLSRVGCPLWVMSTTLPSGYMWADGSLALFSDWPELQAKYNAGGFAGMLLAYTASSYDKSNYPAMLVPNAATPTGLYLPRLGGLFSRNWTPGSGNAGQYNSPGVPNITGRFGANRMGIYEGNNNQCTGSFSRYANNLAIGQYGADIDPNTVSNYFMFNASYSSSLYGASSTVMPPSANMPVAVYLGVHA